MGLAASSNSPVQPFRFLSTQIEPVLMIGDKEKEPIFSSQSNFVSKEYHPLLYENICWGFYRVVQCLHGCFPAEKVLEGLPVLAKCPRCSRSLLASKPYPYNSTIRSKPIQHELWGTNYYGNLKQECFYDQGCVNNNIVQPPAKVILV
jgi:hypothetical protein